MWPPLWLHRGRGRPSSQAQENQRSGARLPLRGRVGATPRGFHETEAERTASLRAWVSRPVVREHHRPGCGIHPPSDLGPTSRPSGLLGGVSFKDRTLTRTLRGTRSSVPPDRHRHSPVHPRVEIFMCFQGVLWPDLKKQQLCAEFLKGRPSGNFRSFPVEASVLLFLLRLHFPNSGPGNFTSIAPKPSFAINDNGLKEPDSPEIWGGGSRRHQAGGDKAEMSEGTVDALR